jgi:hypothetical protein
MSGLTRFADAKWKFQIALGAAALLGLQALLALHLRTGALPFVEPPGEKIEEYNPELFKVMSFGQLPAVIDWMWIKTLEDPVITHVAQGTHPAIFYTLDLITDLDPAFMPAYAPGAVLVSVIRDDGPGALKLLLKGEEFRKTKLPSYDARFRAEHWPREWQVPLLLAYVYLFDMDDMPHAAEAFKAAEQVEGSPYYLKDLIQKLEKPDGQFEVGLRLLGFMISSTKDPDAQERFRDRLESLKISQFLHEMNEKHLKHEPLPKLDPWGGALSITSDGKVTTSTPHRKVFGLE